MSRKNLSLLFCFITMSLLPAGLFAQQYGNEWIDFSKSYFKVKVPKDGLYRIPYTTLQGQAAQGLNINTIAGNTFNMYHNGQVVPIYVTTTGIFTNGDYIEFYGLKNDGSLDTPLYDSTYWQPNEYFSLFNDTSIYYLTWNTAAPNILINNVTNDLTNLPTKEPYCMTKLLQVNANNYNQGRPYYIGTEPLYESIYDEGEGYTGNTFIGSSQNITLSTPGLYLTNLATASLKASVMSTTNSDHHVTVNLNSLPQLANVSYFGFHLNKWNWTIPVNGLSTNNTLVVGASGGSNDANAISYIELTYPNAFNFSNASQVKMSIDGSFGDKYIEVNNYNSNSSAPILYDLTNNLRIVGSAGAAPFKFRLPTTPASLSRDLFLTSQGGTDVTTVGTLDRAAFRNFTNPNNQGDYVIITSSKLQNDGAGNDWVTAYADYRRSITGGTHKVQIAFIDELYDQFGYGVVKNPIAIRNFIRFANNSWVTKPKTVFLIGKGREYANTTNTQNMRLTAGPYIQCLVPTYGYPGSDHLLAATVKGSITPTIPIGRLSASSGEDIRKYLVKVKDFEQVQAEVGDPYQTIASKQWMKQILHLGGGNDNTEQTIFKYYLDNYKAMIEDTAYGANVHSFFKTSTAPIQQAQSDELTSLINNGVSMITFFGHSSPNSFDFSVDDPNNYQNYKKYPLLFSNGCFTGNVFNPTPGISEAFVINENKGAIGFLATPALSSSSALNSFTTQFYQNLGAYDYDQPVGTVIQKSVRDVELCCNNPFVRMAAEGLALHGDPIVKINTHARPDYDLEVQNVSFTPSVVTVQQDTFQVNVIVANLGKAIKDSINFEVVRTLPDGTGVTYTKKVKAPYYQDTLHMSIFTGGNRAFGLNNLQITIDAGDKIKNELSETNNTIGVPVSILSQDVFPIYPYEFSVVPTRDITVKASTANSFAPTRNYIMQMDTTERYNSPLLQSTRITQSGGILKWKPTVNYQDSVVYYWRVGLDTTVNGSGNVLAWHGTSFMYLTNSYPGWNQSHYYQFLKDQFKDEYLDSDRVFKFVSDSKLVSVKTGQYGTTLPDDQIGYSLNGALQERWNCGGSGGFPYGLVFAVFNPATGQPWTSSVNNLITDNGCSNYLIDRTYKSIHCKVRDVTAFDFPTASSCWQQRIVDFIDSIPTGYYVLIYSVNNTSIQYNFFSGPLLGALSGLGSQRINTLATNGVGVPWAFFGQKGNPSFATEAAGTQPTDILNFSATFQARWYQGTINSTVIGPAKKWHTFHWRHSARENPSFDQESVKIIGIRSNGAETVLRSNVLALDTTLEWIDAKVYPSIRLVQNTQDDTTRTPTQLKYWRVLYDKVPEAALNPYAHLEFKSDTVTLGDNLTLSVAIENVTEIPMDSMLVKYSIQNASRGSVSQYQKYDSLRPFASMNLEYKFNTNCNGCLTALNSLVIEANPDNNQPEQFHFNNYGVLPFSVKGDKTNPLLDVTFDQVHILNGDIVSAKPDIMIRLKDENKYLALDDTSLINVFLKSPSGVVQRLSYRDPDVTFTPATPSQLNKNNLAEIRMKKTFTDNGEYELQVQAQDKSRNASGTYGNAGGGIDYRIAFEVVNKSMITNVLNYPNPFTTSTRFVFTMTGAELPTFFKIQIMTITGKVVREIMKDELGPIHIGRNISEFAWDGTDQYGSPLGNGLYLYRVVASMNGKNIDRMETTADKYFKSGFGKMYLAR